MRVVFYSGAMSFSRNKFSNGLFRLLRAAVLPATAPFVIALEGCRSAAGWRDEADRAAARRVESARAVAGAAQEALEVETPSDTLRRRLLTAQELPVFDPASLGIRDLPDNRYWKAEDRLRPGAEGADSDFAVSGTNTLEIGLQDAVRIAAANSPDFRAAKEKLFAAALALDVASHEFHTTLLGAITGSAETSRSEDGTRASSHGESAKPGIRRTFENGVSTDASLAFNIAGMLSGKRRTAWGSLADLSVSIPLLRGSGSLVRRESLTQAERDLVYAVREFEQRKREFVTDVARSYLSLLLAGRTRRNEVDHYRRVVHSARRSRRMSDASRLSKAAFDQAHQSELSARANWIAACQKYETALDSFKTRIGLPPDARVEPREKDLDDLHTLVGRFSEPDSASRAEGSSLSENDQDATDRALAVAFERRSDVMTARDRVEDAQRHLLVAEDALRSEFTIGGSAKVGTAATPSMAAQGVDHTSFRMRDGSATGSFKIDLALDRREEGNAYRSALVALESAVRDYQKAEDGLKATVRQDIRELAQTREQLAIQSRAVELAARRVRNQDLLLEAGRADMTDLLDAQSALVKAQNALCQAVTNWRGQELALQRDIGTLDATVGGVWTETDLSTIGLDSVGAGTQGAITE